MSHSRYQVVDILQHHLYPRRLDNFSLWLTRALHQPLPICQKEIQAVAKKVHPVIGELPEKFRIERKIIGNPLDDLPTLNPNPPLFIPSGHYTLERRDQLDKNHPGNFLWSAERDLMHNFMLAHDSGFAWSEQERGSF
jgi:hypothetical protein